MRPYLFDIDPANVDPDGLADGNSSAGATLTLDGALTSGGTFTSADGLAHRISILDLGADDQSGATYTFVGTDADGIAQTEVVTGPTASATVTTTGYFLTIEATPAISSPVAGSTVDVGTVDEIVSKTLPINYRNTNGATFTADVTGTINYKVEETIDQIHLKAAPSQDASWFGIFGATNLSTDTLKQGTVHASAIRLVVNSYTDTAEIQFTVMQDENI